MPAPTILSRYESTRLPSLCQNERTQEMNLSVLQAGLLGTSTMVDSLMVYDAFQTFGKKIINKGATILKVHKCRGVVEPGRIGVPPWYFFSVGLNRNRPEFIIFNKLGYF